MRFRGSAAAVLCIILTWASVYSFRQHSRQSIRRNIKTCVGKGPIRAPLRSTRENDDKGISSNRGVVSPMPTSLYEVNRRYIPSPSTIERILDSSLRGHVGVVLQLETVMVDLAQAVGYSFSILAGDLKQDTPTPTQIRDSLGGTFKDYAVSLGLNIPDASLPAVEHRWHAILSAVLEKLPAIAKAGVGALISELLAERNDLVVVSSLPIDLAKKVLGKSGLAALFEGRVPGNHLICHDPPASPQEAILQSSTEYGERYRSKLAVRCCGVLKRPPLQCVHVDGNHRHLLSAKRSGFNTVALTGLAANAQLLRTADLVTSDLSTVHVKELYKLVERAVRQGEGPAPQTAAVPQRPQQRTLQVSAPSIGKPRRGGDGEITGEKRQGEVGTGQGSWKEKQNQGRRKPAPSPFEDVFDDQDEVFES